MHALHSNYGITLVVRNNASWAAVSRDSLRTHMSNSCLPLMPEVTCSAVHPISSVSNPKVNEMVARPTFMIHMLDKSLLP